jgi:hypothetical protein
MTVFCCPNGRQQLIAVNTDAQGQARATLTLGNRAGAGSSTVQAYAAGFQGVAVFSASGAASGGEDPVDSGSNQFGPVGTALALPFVAVVSDTSNNRLSGVAVTFTVKQGSGTLAGRSTLQATTDGDGRVLAVLTLGLVAGQDNHVVEATFAGNPGSPAVFTASGRIPGDPRQTVISGIVLDNSNNPIPGVTMRLFPGQSGRQQHQPVQVRTPVSTDAKASFALLRRR